MNGSYPVYSPQDVNYLRYDQLYNQLTYNTDVVTPDATNVDDSQDPVQVLLDGSGRTYLRGSFVIDNGSPTTGMILGTLPSYLVPQVDEIHPVTMLHSTTYSSNFIKLHTSGAGISSIVVNSGGVFTAIPTFGTLGAGSGATFTGHMGAFAAQASSVGTGYVPGDTITWTGGTESANAVVTVNATQLVSTATNAAGSGYAPGDLINLSGGTALTPAQLAVITTKLVSAAVNAPGSGYAINDTITTAGGTASSHAILTVTSAQLVSLAINAAGSGYAVNDTITLAGGTHSIAAVVTVTSVSSGAITGISITTPGSYTVESTTFTQASTSGSGTGATFNTGLFGVLGFSISTPGSYTVNSTTLTQSSSSGSGTGATFNTALYGVLTQGVNVVGSYTANASSFTQASTSGSGTGATFNTVVWGVHLVSVTTPGNYTVLPSQPIAQGATSGVGSGATFTLVTWKLVAVAVGASGSGYNDESTIYTIGGGQTVQPSLTIVLGTSSVGQIELLNAPANGDTIFVDGVEFMVNSYSAP